MKNANRVIGQMMATVVKRLKSSGLPQATIEKAILAAKGDSHPNTPIKLSALMRSKLFALVKERGPLVVTGRTTLKIFTLDSYAKTRAASSLSARKHAPWLKAAAQKKQAAVEARQLVGAK